MIGNCRKVGRREFLLGEKGSVTTRGQAVAVVRLLTATGVKATLPDTMVAHIFLCYCEECREAAGRNGGSWAPGICWRVLLWSWADILLPCAYLA